MAITLPMVRTQTRIYVEDVTRARDSEISEVSGLCADWGVVMSCIESVFPRVKDEVYRLYHACRPLRPHHVHRRLKNLEHPKSDLHDFLSRTAFCSLRMIACICALMVLASAQHRPRARVAVLDLARVPPEQGIRESRKLYSIARRLQTESFYYRVWRRGRAEWISGIAESRDAEARILGQPSDAISSSSARPTRCDVRLRLAQLTLNPMRRYLS